MTVTMTDPTLDEAIAIGRRRRLRRRRPALRRPVDDHRLGDRRRVARADHLRRPHRPGGPAGPGLPPLRVAELRALVRHRWARSRRAQPGDPRCPRHDPPRRAAGLPGDDHRRDSRRRRRLLRGGGRRHDHAPQRPRVRLPADHPGDGGGRLARARVCATPSSPWSSSPGRRTPGSCAAWSSRSAGASSWPRRGCSGRPTGGRSSST